MSNKDKLAKNMAGAEEVEAHIADLFKLIINNAIKELPITELEIARGLKVSVATVERWRSGASAPHPLGQPQILEWFQKKYAEKEQK